MSGVILPAAEAALREAVPATEAFSMAVMGLSAGLALLTDMAATVRAVSLTADGKQRIRI